MDDKELADNVVALGVGEYRLDGLNDSKYGFGIWGMTAKQFVRDWRVAGALMEKVLREAGAIERVFENALGESKESFPRAINEAACEVLGAEQ